MYFYKNGDKVLIEDEFGQQKRAKFCCYVGYPKPHIHALIKFQYKPSLSLIRIKQIVGHDREWFHFKMENKKILM